MPASPLPTSRDIAVWTLTVVVIALSVFFGWVSISEVVVAIAVDLVHGWATRPGKQGTSPRGGDDEADDQSA